MLRAMWLYALLAKIHRPLHPEVLAAIRLLLRYCAEKRANLKEGSNDTAELLPRLNLLIAISGGYFGQDEQMAAMFDIDDL